MITKSTFTKYTVCAGLALSLVACDDWLNNQPKGEMIPETLDDYQMLLNGQSLYSASEIYYLFLTDDVLLTGRNEIPGFSDFEYSGMYEENKNAYSFANGYIFLPSDHDDAWEDGYNHIFVYNAIINNVLSATGGTDADRRRVWAEALVGRAYEYLKLVNLYGKHYDAATAESDYGVPLVLNEEITGEQYSRASVAQVYSQILSDLEQAVPYLSTVAANKFTPSQSTSYAFLARTQLYMGDYTSALSNANLALEQNDYLLDYKLYTTTTGTWGRIIEKENSNGYFPDADENDENIYARVFNGTSYLYGQTAVSEDLLEAFARNLPENAIDKRLDLFFATDSFNLSNSGYEKFEGYTTYIPYIYQNVGLSTPEVYLIAAECEARVGDKDRAIELLNTLRDKRIENNVHYDMPTVLSSDDVLGLVLDERRREFALLGTYRLIDLKRLNRESSFAKTITHTAGSEGTWTLPPNDPRYIIPVPANVIGFNPMPEYER